MDAKKSKVIIVDDSKFSSKMIGEIVLSNESFSISSEFHSAIEALEFVKENENQIDIALIDVVMPVMSGIELAQKISAVSPETQIIMISSLAGENIIIDSITAGAVDYIQKPFSKEKLLSSMMSAVENSRGF